MIGQLFESNLEEFDEMDSTDRSPVENSIRNRKLVQDKVNKIKFSKQFQTLT